MKYINLIATTKKQKEELYKRYLDFCNSSDDIFYVLKPTLIGEKNDKLIFAKSYMTMTCAELKRYVVIGDFFIKGVAYDFKSKDKNKNPWSQVMPFSKSWVSFMCMELNAISPSVKQQYLKDFEKTVRKYREEQKYRLEEIYNQETENFIVDTYNLTQKTDEKTSEPRLSEKYLNECLEIAKKLIKNDSQEKQ